MTPERYFVFRNVLVSESPPRIGYGSEREAALYLAQINKSGNHNIVRPVPDDPATIVDLELNGRVFSLADALLELTETEP